jgi:hypothetical protein
MNLPTIDDKTFRTGADYQQAAMYGYSAMRVPDPLKPTFEDSELMVMGPGQSFRFDIYDAKGRCGVGEAGEGTVLDVCDMDGDGDFIRFYAIILPDGRGYHLSET